MEGIVGEPPKGRISAIFSLRIWLGRLKVRRPFGEVLEHDHLVALQPPLQSWTCLPSTGSGSPKGERSSILWCFNSFHEINVTGTVGGKLLDRRASVNYGKCVSDVFANTGI